MRDADVGTRLYHFVSLSARNLHAAIWCVCVCVRRLFFAILLAASFSPGSISVYLTVFFISYKINHII